MSLFGRNREKAKHVRGLARAFGYLAVTGAVFSIFSVRFARAELQEQTITIGRQMMELARASNHEVTHITFNGEKMFLGSSVSEEPAKNVLDRYEAHCKQNPGQPAEGWSEIEKLGGQKVAQGGSAAELPAGLMRSGDDAEGSVLCFVRSAETKATTEEAFKAFAETGDIGAFGKLRYAYAKKTPTGRTLILTAWTDEKFNIGRIMPKPGVDVPGEDFPEIPRVPNSTRALSSRAEGTPYALNIYKTSDSAAKVVGFYDKEMVGRGFQGFDPELDEAKEGGLGRTYVKDGVVVTVATRLDPAGNFVVLGLAGVSADDTLGGKRSR
jgi:hypothetical protein